MSHRLVIFGASGDLTSRKLMPALAQLHEAGQLPPGFSVLGIARDDWGTHRLREALERYASDVSLQSRNALVSAVEYRRAEVTDPGQVIAALPATPRADHRLPGPAAEGVSAHARGPV